MIAHAVVGQTADEGVDEIGGGVKRTS